MLIRQSHPHRQHGMSLIELMVAIVIGTILMTGLVAMFTNSSRSRRELEKTGVLIENGRYAMSVLYDDIRTAGFYGYYYAAMTTPTTMPDPCVTVTGAGDSADLTKLKDAMAMAIEGFTAPDMSSDPDISATSCGSLLTSSNLQPGSDILVVRRASTAVFTGNPTNNLIYLQANVRDANLQIGNSTATVSANTSTGDTADDNATTMLYKYPSKTGNIVADTRQYEVHVYFVAPCSKGSGSNGVCQTGDDSIPTLKRLVLSVDPSSGSSAMVIEPLVEGIEYMKLSYGIDTSPSSTSTETGFTGDGMPDSYTSTPTTAQWPLVDGVRVSLLVRSSDPTQDYTDLKKYVLGTTTVGPFNDKYYRHVFNTEILCKNLAGRRVIPQ